jgi:hypothetical protein
MNAFLKDNIAIVAAIVLPALLALIFMASTLFSRVSVPDPQNDFFIATNYNDGNSSMRFDVVSDKLVIGYRPPEKLDNGGYNYNQKPRLWRVRVPAMTVEEIALQEPAQKVATNLVIPGVTDITVRNIQPGPDGYSFMDVYRYDRNLMSEIFSAGSSYNRSGMALINNGRAVPISTPQIPNWDYYNTRFVGWVIKTP